MSKPAEATKRKLGSLHSVATRLRMEEARTFQDWPSFGEEALNALVEELAALRETQESKHDGGDGLTNGTTPVTMVDSPQGGQKRIVQSVFVYNADTASAAVLIKKNTRAVTGTDLAAGETLSIGIPIVLTSSDTLDIVLESPVATNELDWVVSYQDKGVD